LRTRTLKTSCNSSARPACLKSRFMSEINSPPCRRILPSDCRTLLLKSPASGKGRRRHCNVNWPSIYVCDFAACQAVRNPLYRRHRIPAEVIAHAVWLYFRFPLSLRMVEDLLAAHGGSPQNVALTLIGNHYISVRTFIARPDRGLSRPQSPYQPLTSSILSMPSGYSRWNMRATKSQERENLMVPKLS
jgi:hypothetical protein